MGHIDLLDANNVNLITQVKNGITVTTTNAGKNDWGHVDNLIAPSINAQKLWDNTTNYENRYYWVGLYRNTDITITLPVGTELSEIILTPWMEFEYWPRIMNIKVELYNDNNAKIGSNFIEEYLNNDPYKGPGSNYGPVAYLISEDNQKLWTPASSVLATIPGSSDHNLTDSDRNYRTVLFVNNNDAYP